MKFDRRDVVKALGMGAVAAAIPEAAFAKRPLRIALVVKVLGMSYFDVAHKGAVEAADVLGGVDLIYTGPADATVEEQAAVVDALIAQRVDALVISANDETALVPTTRRAMQRGIVVISFDSGIAPEGRLMHVNAPHDVLIGANDVRMISKTLKGQGDVAILSATSEATNQNIWIEMMKEEWKKPEYKDLHLVGVVYGDDVLDKSYREAQGLFKAYSNLRGIISPTTVGILASAKAVADGGLTGKVYVTGHGLPSEMKPAVLAGVTDTFQLWNPADLGYAGVMFAGLIVRHQITGQANTTANIGRLGEMTIEANHNTYLKNLLVFDRSNIDQYSKEF